MHHPQIALQKNLCFFFVIVLHALLPFTNLTSFCTVYTDMQAGNGDTIARILHFSLFPSLIFASGFLLEKAALSASGFDEIVKKRIKRLVVPWFMTMLFWLVPLYVIFGLPACNRLADASFWATLLAGLQGRFTGHLGFLLSLFWASMFWLIVGPLLKRTPLPAFLNKSTPNLQPDFAKCKTWFDQSRPNWINPEWFTLRGAIPSISTRDRMGLGLAFVAAVTLQVACSHMTWYGFQQAAGSLIFLYCGMLAYRHYEALNAFLLLNFGKLFAALALPFLILAPVGHVHFLFAWMLGVLGALLTYMISLLLVRFGLDRQKDANFLGYVERNLLRLYLFHMPVVLVISKGLTALDAFSPWPCVMVASILTLAVTAGLVQCSHWAERVILPQIVAGMRPKN